VQISTANFTEMLHGAGKYALDQAIHRKHERAENRQIHINIIESFSHRAHDRQKFGLHGRSCSEKSVF
jgi:hypothetical protein